MSIYVTEYLISIALKKWIWYFYIYKCVLRLTNRCKSWPARAAMLRGRHIQHSNTFSKGKKSVVNGYIGIKRQILE